MIDRSRGGCPASRTGSNTRTQFVGSYVSKQNQEWQASEWQAVTTGVDQGCASMAQKMFLRHDRTPFENIFQASAFANIYSTPWITIHSISYTQQMHDAGTPTFTPTMRTWLTQMYSRTIPSLHPQPAHTTPAETTSSPKPAQHKAQQKVQQKCQQKCQQKKTPA